MWRGVRAVVSGYVVSYVVGAVVIFLSGTSHYFVATLAGRALGGFLGGFTAAHLAVVNPLRWTAAFGILLLVGQVVSLFWSDEWTPFWFFAALAVLFAAFGVGGGFLRTSIGRRFEDRLDATMGKVLQLSLGVAFLLASTTAVGGYGGTVLGFMAFVSPMVALVAAFVVTATTAAALVLDAQNFAVFCTVLLLPVIVGLVMIWSSVGFQTFWLLSATPLLGVWTWIVARAVLGRRHSRQ